ncbi:MAG: hypothetical protein KF760_13120 [Candidatus Eremiobacteraeota bacterium]|nr:hypothetical protein [Candidatus Eremiobacteraeota bacterium]MCW5867008.1 hypothetical protein [Candidatus Eremiobacteraeota bacterium]
MRKLLLLLWVLTLPAWCKDWSHTGTTWKHSNGMSVTFPADFQVQEADNGVLTVIGKQGFITYIVQGMVGEAAYKGWLGGQQQFRVKSDWQVKSEFSKANKNGLQGQFLESEHTNQEGILFVGIAVAFSKGKDYLCLQMLYPKLRESDWSPLLSDTVNSVKAGAKAKPVAKPEEAR